MSEVVLRLGWREEVEKLAAEVPQAIDGAFVYTADKPLELGEDQFDWVQVRTVRPSPLTTSATGSIGLILVPSNVDPPNPHDS